MRTIDRAARVALVAIVVVGVSAAVAPAVSAQDCGRECRTCLIAYHEGSWHGGSAKYDMDCTMSGECDKCNILERVGDAPLTAAAILEEVAQAADVGAVVGKHRDRLLMVSSRSLVAVRGTGCDAQQIAAVRYVRPELQEALKRLGVQELGAYLAGLGRWAGVFEGRY